MARANATPQLGHETGAGNTTPFDHTGCESGRPRLSALKVIARANETIAWRESVRSQLATLPEVIGAQN